ncbi:hypothetical protein OG417_44885 [Actinoallomurus sp. NBC_01490]|uniref:hypothetical protein n=1 Tax=Actinoallomurus sp. NBC_01490 TaxID=2903557 RepID=UPI002E3064F4|nr:hypothetical protein [Actinoallomurus sp. NBC_01490]
MPAWDTRTDRTPWRVYTRDAATGLLTHDGLIYRGEHCARREARKISRVLGRPAEAQPATAAS